MNTKNLFTFNAITAVLFASPMMLFSKMVADMYLTHPEKANDATWVIMRGYGSLLFALTVAFGM